MTDIRLSALVPGSLATPAHSAATDVAKIGQAGADVNRFCASRTKIYDLCPSYEGVANFSLRWRNRSMSQRLDPHSAALLIGRQIKAARILLDWSQEELAQRAGVHRNSTSRAEAGAADVKASTIRHLVEALEAAGVEFLAASQSRGEGVRLRKPFARQG